MLAERERETELAGIAARAITPPRVPTAALDPQWLHSPRLYLGDELVDLGPCIAGGRQPAVGAPEAVQQRRLELCHLGVGDRGGGSSSLAQEQP